MGFNSATSFIPSAGGALNPRDGQKLTGALVLPHVKLGMDTVYYNASGAITIRSGAAVLTKSTASAMTIGAPTADEDGKVLVITAQTGTAHTVTGVALLADGATGAPHSTATYAAAVGASMTLMACNLLWNVIALQGVTVA